MSNTPNLKLIRLITDMTTACRKLADEINEASPIELEINPRYITQRQEELATCQNILEWTKTQPCACRFKYGDKVKMPAYMDSIRKQTVPERTGLTVMFVRWVANHWRIQAGSDGWFKNEASERFFEFE